MKKNNEGNKERKQRNFFMMRQIIILHSAVKLLNVRKFSFVFNQTDFEIIQNYKNFGNILWRQYQMFF